MGRHGDGPDGGVQDVEEGAPGEVLLEEREGKVSEATQCPATTGTADVGFTRCELTAGHKGPHMMDRGEGVPALSWGDGSDAPPVAEAPPVEAGEGPYIAASGLSTERLGAVLANDTETYPDAGVVVVPEAFEELQNRSGHGDEEARSILERWQPAQTQTDSVPSIAEAALRAAERATAATRDVTQDDAAMIDGPFEGELEVPLVRAKVRYENGEFVGQLLDFEPETGAVGDSLPELFEGLIAAVRESLKVIPSLDEVTDGWQLFLTYDVWGGRSQVDSGREESVVVLTDGSIDDAVIVAARRIAARLEQNGERFEEFQCESATRLGEVYVG
jgi:hypothetical protein